MKRNLSLLFAVLCAAVSLFGQTNSSPWYDPMMHTQANTGAPNPVVNTPQSTWNPGSTMQPQTQNPYVVDLARAASHYSPPNPYVHPTPQQTQWYVNNHPALWNLPSSAKEQIVSGNTTVLSGSYLPNGTPNPFYSNGRIIPNWYLPATWPSIGTSWAGVQPNGFLPNSTNMTYNPSASFGSISINRPSTPVYQPPSTSNISTIAVTRPAPSDLNKSQQNPAPNFIDIHREALASNPFYSNGTDVTRSIESTKRSLELSEAAGDKVGQVTSHAALAQLFARQGELENARTQIGFAERLADKSANPSLEVVLLRTQASITMASGGFEEAIANYQKAIAALKELKDESDLAEVQTSLGWAFQSVGDVRQALAAYEEAQKLFAALGNHDGEIRVALGIGSLYQSMGEFDKASAEYIKVAQFVSGEQRARMLVSVAEMYVALNDPQNALSRYEKALNLTGGQNSALQVSILTGIGRCYMAARKYAAAQRYFQEADAKAASLGDRRLQSGVLASVGELNYWRAISPPLPSTSLRMPDSDPFRSFHESLLNSGRLSPAADGEIRYRYFIPDPGKYFSEALKHYKSSLALTQAAGDRIGEIGILTNIGLAYDAWDKQHDALNYYLNALKKLEDLQTAARLEEFRVDLASQSTRLYQRAVELEIRQHRPEEAFNLTERSRARMLLDQLGNTPIDPYKEASKDFIQQEENLRRRNITLQRQLAQEMARPTPEMNAERIQSLQTRIAQVQREYQDALLRLKLSNPAYSSFVSVSPLSLDEVQRNLPPEVTLVSYFTTLQATFAFVITRKDFHVAKLPVNEAQLTEAILNFHDFAGPGSESAALKLLHSWLIEPLGSRLKTAKLVFVPHGILNDLPFGALNSDGANYLNDSYAISYLPSASALAYLKPANRHGNQIVVLANDQEEGAPPLSHAYEEARAVASLGTARLLLGNEASASMLNALGGDYDIVHLIGHVYVDNSYPRFSRISLGPTLEQDGVLDLNRVLRLNLHQTRLVVLSGCQTQVGSRSRGDDVISLNRAFLYAGASSVIASLWSVDDDATTALMIAFYRHLQKEPDRAQALRKAQMEIRQKYPDPYYWAGFVLTGDRGESANPNLVASGVSPK